MKGFLLIFKVKVAGTLSCVAAAILLFSINSFAQLNYKYVFQFRSVPGAKNFLATAAYDGLLWGNMDKQKPLYGYYKLGVTLGGSPTAAVFAEVAPIAPVIFKLQRSTTYRYLPSQVFDCENVYCYGVLDRTDFSVSMVAGYSNVVGLFSYLWRDLRLPTSSNSVLAEQELVAATGGNQHYNEMSLTLGYLLESKNIVGLHYTAGEFSEANHRSSSLYGVYRCKWRDWELTTGIGSYQSDQDYVGGNGVIFSIGKKIGDSLSLF